MSLDLIEIALDGLTDHRDFEKLASEIMREEGYPNIKPLGGVGDDGQDAIQESYFLSEGRTRVVFQYTLQESLPGKIEETIDKLSKAKIDYHELVIVTRHSISTRRQEDMIKDARKKHGVNLSIYERKTLVNRLANYSNGIFNRHFPDIQKQVLDLTSKKPRLSAEEGTLLESSMLKASIAFTFGAGAPSARKSIFDFLTLGILLENPHEGIRIAEMGEKYTTTVGGEKPPDEQIGASLGRLISGGFVERKEDIFKPSDSALQTMASSTIRANEATDSVISDIIDDVCRILEEKLSEEDKRRIARNTRDLFVKLFRLFGIELSNQVLRDSTPSPVYLDSSEELLSTARRQLSPKLGELLISVIAQTFKSPTEEQAQTFANWALAYLGAEIMNLDPYLKEFQATRCSNKIYILDTDFILDSLVRECPRSKIYASVIASLRALGCKVIIPEACIQECANHAKYSPRTYYYFGPKLLTLNKMFVDERIGNVFVKGYYHGYMDGSISPRITFQEYLQNYYEPSAPAKFITDVIATTFPAGIEIMNPTTLLTENIPKDQLSALGDVLLDLILKSPKSAYRSKKECEELAETDARLFLTALYLSGKSEETSGHILGGQCYLITESARYLRSAPKIGLRDVVTTRPQSLIALMDLIGGIKITPTEFVSLFENPLLIYAVSKAWDDVQALLDSGVLLEGKSIARLRWDLDQGLHENIAAYKEAEAKAEATEEPADEEITDEKYLDLLKAAESGGYAKIPELDFLIKAVERAENDAKAKSDAYDELLQKYAELEENIKHFGRRKQRYLKRISRQKNG
jgi:hypothetical protein